MRQIPTLGNIAAELEAKAATVRTTPFVGGQMTTEQRTEHQEWLNAKAAVYDRAASIIRHQIECEA